MTQRLAALTRDHWRAVSRIRRLPVPLADCEAIYRRERARLRPAPQSGPQADSNALHGPKPEAPT